MPTLCYSEVILALQCHPRTADSSRNPLGSLGGCGTSDSIPARGCVAGQGVRIRILQLFPFVRWRALSVYLGWLVFIKLFWRLRGFVVRGPGFVECIWRCSSVRYVGLPPPPI